MRIYFSIALLAVLVLSCAFLAFSKISACACSRQADFSVVTTIRERLPCSWILGSSQSGSPHHAPGTRAGELCPGRKVRQGAGAPGVMVRPRTWPRLFPSII